MKALTYHFFLLYLRLAAKIQLWKIRPKHVVGITGSAGKSSCREAVCAILKERYLVKSGTKSLNTEVGLPLDILGFTENYTSLPLFYLKVVLLTPFKLLFDWKRYEIYIAEMGVDKPGDMDHLLSILRPDIAVFLNALPVHTQNFPGKDETESVRKIAAEKGKLIESLPAGGWAIVNLDDANVARYQIPTAKYQVLTVGKSGEIKPLLVDLPGFLLTEDYGYTLAAAVAVGKILGIKSQEAKKNLEKNFKLPPGRMSVFAGIKNTTIIDSSYNSSPGPCVSALKLLAKQKGRKIAVLGDMRELGKLEKEEHEKVAREALADSKMTFVFGPMTEKYFPNSAKIQKFRQMTNLTEAVKKYLKQGDLVLIKGSQNTIFLERLVKDLLADPQEASKLCRRGEFWEKKRRETE